jgi:SAM-dependent methyltransferase
MNFYSDETYGERVAGVYDDWHNKVEAGLIDRLAELAGDGHALELGIGTGRIALPLAQRGIKVSGIDAATSMIERLKSKEGAGKIAVHRGSFADFSIDEKFQLVYVVFNTLFALGSQEEQVRCFRSVASHLASGGSFVIEAFVPNLSRFTEGQVNWATKVDEERVELDVGRFDAATQRVVSQKVVITDGSVKLYPVQIRFAWPSELDLMAQLAGLRLRERWSNWERAPFDSDSGKHISIYEKE